jgi:hypothetical protein
MGPVREVIAVAHEREDVDWPEAFPRTDPQDREPYPDGFRVPRSEAFENVLEELRGWEGVTDVRLDSGAEHQQRNPNKPYADATVTDPGVVVYFTKDGQAMAAACDRWDNLRDNAQDLYYYLHETRLQERRGTVTGESEYEKLRLPSGDATAAEPPAHAVLGVEPDASQQAIEVAFRRRVKEVHPDQPDGDEAAFKRLQRAREVLADE